MIMAFIENDRDMRNAIRNGWLDSDGRWTQEAADAHAAGRIPDPDEPVGGGDD